jgi:hypothetical protein
MFSPYTKFCCLKSVLADAHIAEGKVLDVKTGLPRGKRSLLKIK